MNLEAIAYIAAGGLILYLIGALYYIRLPIMQHRMH